MMSDLELDYDEYDLYDAEDDENNPDNYMHDMNYDPVKSSAQQVAYLETCESDASSVSSCETQHSDVTIPVTSTGEDNIASIISENQPELIYQSPEKESLPLPLPNATDSEESDIILVEKFNNLVKRIPYLTIPCHFGFIRKVIDTSVTLGDDDKSGQRVVYEHNDNVLACIEDVHTYLLDQSIPLPVSSFTFAARINPHVQYFKNCWKEMIYKDDLSEGKEIKKIQVICPKTRFPEKLAAEYVMDNFMDESLNINIEHDDGFFVCCECPNDCRDKLNCPCFQRTLDNCSKQTRNLVGDQNIGYNFHRLYSPVLSGIYECSKKCKCRKNTCLNRIVQNGINCNLQLFITDLKGWGVRTLCDIPRGKFVATYSGKIVSGQYADQVSSNWYSGKWKYLSELRVSNEFKEGYEAEVVEPGVIETTNIKNDDEWDEWEHSEDDGDDGDDKDDDHQHHENQLGMGPEEWEDFKRDDGRPEEQPPSRATSCFLAAEALETAATLYNEIDPKPSTSSSSRAVRRRRSSTAPVATRILRSTDTEYQESFQDYELLPTGKIGLVKKSLKDVLILSRYNRKAEKQSRTSQTNKKTPAFYMFLEDFQTMRKEDLYYKNLNELQIKRANDRKRRDERLSKSARLSAQYVVDHVLKSIKLDNQLTTTTSLGPSVCNTLNIISVFKKRFTLCTLGGKKLKRTRRRRKRLLIYKKCATRATNNNGKVAVHPLLDLNFNIDGRETGNIGRYFNHSCDPNIVPQYVFTNSHDLRFPRIAFFAKRDIIAGEELTWDYNYEPTPDKVKEEEQHRHQQKVENHVQEQLQANIGDDKGNNNNDIITKTSLTPAISTKRLDIKRGTRRGIRNGCGTSRRTKRTATPPTRLQCHCGEDNCKRRFC